MSYYNPLHLYLKEQAQAERQPYMATYRQPVFDWLSEIRPATGQKMFDCVEVHFKNGRKEFFKNPDNLSLRQGDVVVTEASIGYDVGTISLTGELVKIQMRKKKVANDEKLLRIYRKAHQRDLAIWQQVQNKEIAVQKTAREIALSLGLEMKISDVEFQGDGSKATFYYTADERVDFRQLIKDLAREFAVRIEMRQIGFRQEASRLGGIGSCGREVCGSTWMNDFKAVTSLSMRNQQLPISAQKLSGQCGKQKCCMNFELEVYMDALKDFPRTNTKLLTDKGLLSCQKIDILQKLLWYTAEEEHPTWHKLSVEQVKEIIERNAQGETPALEEYTAKWLADLPIIGASTTGITEESISRFDEPKRKNKKNKNKEKNTRTEGQNNNNSTKQKNTKHNPKTETTAPKTEKISATPKKEYSEKEQQIGKNTPNNAAASHKENKRKKNNYSKHKKAHEKQTPAVS